MRLKEKNIAYCCFPMRRRLIELFSLPLYAYLFSLLRIGKKVRIQGKGKQLYEPSQPSYVL